MFSQGTNKFNRFILLCLGRKYEKNTKKLLIGALVASTVTTFSTPAIALAADSPKYKDGKYTGEAFGFVRKGSSPRAGVDAIEHGFIMEVTIKDGKITDVQLLNSPNNNKTEHVYPDNIDFPDTENHVWETMPIHLKKNLQKQTDYEAYLSDWLENVKKLEQPSDKQRTKPKYDPASIEIRSKYLDPDAVDTVAGATYSAIGMAEATLNALDKAKIDENAVNYITEIRNVSLSKNTFYVGETLDLNDLSVEVEYKNGDKETVSYKDFEDKNLEVSLFDANNGTPIDSESDTIKLTYTPIKIVIESTSEESDKTVSGDKTISMLKKTRKPKSVKYRIEGYKDFKDAKVDTTGYFARIVADIPKDSDKEKPIEILVEEYTDHEGKVSLKHPYMSINHGLNYNKTSIRANGRDGDSPEDLTIIFEEPENYNSFGDNLSLDFKVNRSMTWEKDANNSNTNQEEKNALKTEIAKLKEVIKEHAEKVKSEGNTDLSSALSRKVNNGNYSENGKDVFKLRAIKFNLTELAKKLDLNIDENDKEDPNTDDKSDYEVVEDKTGEFIGVSLDNGGVSKNFIENKEIKSFQVTANNGAKIDSIKGLPTGLTLKDGSVSGTPKVAANEWDPTFYGGNFKSYNLEIKAVDEENKTIYVRNYEIFVDRDNDKDGISNGEDYGKENIFNPRMDYSPIIVDGKAPTL